MMATSAGRRDCRLGASGLTRFETIERITGDFHSGKVNSITIKVCTRRAKEGRGNTDWT
jgi:hypothetical protein